MVFFFFCLQVGELSQQLEIESKKYMELEAQNQDLQEELSTMRGNHEKLEKSKCQLKEEVANLKLRLETNMVDHSQMEQYKREMEERASQEIRQKLQEVNLFLQVTEFLTWVCSLCCIILFCLVMVQYLLPGYVCQCCTFRKGNGRKEYG